MRRILERLIGRRRSRIADRVRAAVAGRSGLEVGGASRIFSAKGRLPVYPHAAGLDGVDYRAATHRHPDRALDADFRWHPARASGRLLFCEAVDLQGVPDDSSDFLLASHVLEHIANPLQALASWRRVTKPAGALLLVVPHREGTFDHRRPVTELAHLIADLEADVGEDDLTHLEEVLALHDLDRDPGLDSKEMLERRGRANLEHRGLHHHVFDPELVLRSVDHAGWQVEAVDVMQPYHIAVLARKREADGAGNERWWAPDATWRARSPFPADR